MSVRLLKTRPAAVPSLLKPAPQPPTPGRQRDAAPRLPGPVLLLVGTVLGTSSDGAGNTRLRIAATTRVKDTVEKTICRVTVRGSEGSAAAGRRGPPARAGDLVHCVGLLSMTPRFDSISLSYDYTHDVVVTPSFGSLRPITVDKFGTLGERRR